MTVGQLKDHLFYIKDTTPIKIYIGKKLYGIVGAVPSFGKTYVTFMCKHIKDKK